MCTCVALEKLHYTLFSLRALRILAKLVEITLYHKISNTFVLLSKKYN